MPIKFRFFLETSYLLNLRENRIHRRITMRLCYC